MTKDQLTSFVRDEINPIKELAREAIEKKMEQEEFVPTQRQSIEMQKENRRREFMQMFDIEEKQKAFRKGLATFQHLYPSELDANEQKRLTEEMATTQKKFIEALKTNPNEQFKTSSFILACMTKVANAAFLKKNYADALSIYETILALDNKLDNVWISYGQCLKESNRPDEALKAFRSAWAINKGNHS